MKTRLSEDIGNGKYLAFRCEGCGGYHSVPVTGPQAWAWNGDRDAPVLSPSLKVNMGPYDAPRICHSFVGCNGAQPGEIIYLGDCTHHLAGQVRPLSNWKEET
jgi:hypothetical protein